MDRKTLTIILAVGIIGCFLFTMGQDFGAKFSGFDLVTAKGAGWKQYILLLIPISALLLLLGAFNGNYAFGRGLLCVLPIVDYPFYVYHKSID